MAIVARLLRGEPLELASRSSRSRSFRGCSRARERTLAPLGQLGNRDICLPRPSAGMVSSYPTKSVSSLPAPLPMREGLPVSVMLVGKHFDEPTIYRAAYAFEQAGDWKHM
jgi:hypothetical protein